MVKRMIISILFIIFFIIFIGKTESKEFFDI